MGEPSKPPCDRCLVLDFTRTGERRWEHLAKPPLPEITNPLNLDPTTGLPLPKAAK